MNSTLKKELLKEANSLKAKFFIGKKGIDSNLIKALKEYLDKHYLVKIKIQSTSNKEEITQLIQKLLLEIENSYLVQIKGFTATIYKKN